MCLSLDKVLHAQLLTIKHGIGAEVYPLAQDEQAGLTREHEVKFDVTMTVDEIIDVGVRLQIFLGIDDKRLILLAHISGRSLTFVLEATMLGPFQPKLYAPARVNASKQTLQHRIVEHGTKEQELAVLVAKSITVSEVEELTLNLGRERFIVHRHTTLLG